MEERDPPTFSCILPLKTVSEANSTEHWTAKRKRHKTQQAIVRMKLFEKNPDIKLPCLIELVRIAPRNLDYDNLVSSFKWIVDSLCDSIIPGLSAGRADSNPNIHIDYFQKKGKPKEYAIQIKIYCL